MKVVKKMYRIYEMIENGVDDEMEVLRESKTRMIS
jgi:hypothetical protein